MNRTKSIADNSQNMTRSGALLWALASLVLFRATAEVGHYSAGGALLPIRVASSGIAIVAIALFVFNTADHSREKVSGAGLVTAVFFFWTLIAFWNFGFTFDLAGEFVRSLAAVAIFVLAYRLGTKSGSFLPRSLEWLVGLPAVALIGGFLAGWSPTILAVSGRASGTFAHPNSAGAYFAVGAVACLWGYIKTRRKASLAVAFAAMFALLLTMSLGGLAGLIAGTATLVGMSRQLSFSRKIWLLLFSVAAGLTLAQSTGILERLNEFQRFNDGYLAPGGRDSLEWRFLNWRLLLEIWLEESPIFGLGWGATRFEVLPLDSLPHNIYVQLLAELGVIGIGITVIFILIFAKSTVRRYRSNKQEASLIAAIGVTILAHGLVGNWLNYVPAQYLALFTLGVAFGCSRTEVASKGRKWQNRATSETRRDLRSAQ